MSRFADCSVTDDIVDRARRGNPAANEAIYRVFATPVYNLALRITRHTAAAEEVLQDTFIEVLKSIAGYRGAAPIGYWIREITVNKCLMLLRSGWHRKSRPLADAATEMGEGTTPPPEPALLDLEKALDRLTPLSRGVVWLHDVEGYTHHEIGRLMGKSSSFSKSQLARAHQRLRGLLGNNVECETQCMQLSNNY
jgi:RNA polymerase sigma-70 factor (ECF subfamily)